MSDTCIVCLGDLSNGDGDTSTIPTTLAKSPRPNGGTAFDTAVSSPTPDPVETTILPTDEAVAELIAHIQPCGHYLHNECLTPWVERANSCPICRASFNLVELTNKIGGTIISSYTVEDRTQVAELDPSIFLEIPDDEEDEQPCQACGEDDNEDVLMYCDGCQKLWHTYCVDLQEVPYGPWFCDNCRAQREVDPRQVTRGRAARPFRRRTRGQQRRQRTHRVAHDSSWNQVWQSVWSRLNFDLDFPHDEDDSSAVYIRRHRQRVQANRQAHDAWLRRMQVAELHGAGNRFRETEPPVVSSPGAPVTNHHILASPQPPTETAEEAQAWNAFEQARAAPIEPKKSNRRKRKSKSPSPEVSEQDTGPSTVKRRRVSLPPTNGDDSDRAQSSTSTARQPPFPTFPRPLLTEPAAPSFLQSLLQEVEESSSAAPNQWSLPRPSRVAGSPAADQYSPGPSSPALSPLPSNYSSPRAMPGTPPPLLSLRPGSPTGLSSSIQPVFPSTEPQPIPPPVSASTNEPRENGNRESPPPRPANTWTAPPPPPTILAQPKPKSRFPKILEQHPHPTTRTRSNETSPTRASLSLTAKSDVQKLVSAALNPHYNEQTISKEEYTNINRDISRMLYDKIGNFEALDIDGRAKWERIAGEEVNKAVSALRAQG